jgi:two-component system response regulator (stage 0 sporulation protein A)
MADLISILIADDNTDFCDLLKEYIDGTGDMLVKGIAKNGRETLDMIKELSPDIVLLDIIMPQLDGIGVLEALAEMKVSQRPILIVLTAIGKDNTVRKAVELGADYYIMKPFDPDMLVSHIRYLYNARSGLQKRTYIKAEVTGEPAENVKSLEQTIGTLIKRMGVTPNIAGYRYLSEAVMLAVKRPAVLTSVTKLIYPQLATKFNTTAKNIDRSIRCAINSACNKTRNIGSQVQGIITISCAGKKPGNSEVIRFLTEKALNMIQTR